MAPPPPALPIPTDHAFQGSIALSVDATDIARKVFRIHETIPVQAPGPLTLFYPRWEIASHAPTGPIWAMAGLLVTADSRRLEWYRDAVDPYAFHIDVPHGARQVDLSLQYLSPNSGAIEMTPELLTLTWSRTLLYPAGWFARDIPVQPSVTLPAGFKFASALNPLDHQGSGRGGTIRFQPVSLEVLADSPLYAGRHTLHLDLAPGAAAPVMADFFADTDTDLAVDGARLAHLRAGIRAVSQVFGHGHYRRYDMLVSLSDHIPPDGGLEHQASSEVNLPADFLLNPNRTLSDETLFTHEYVHSWNGVSRQGVGIWTPDLNTPKRDGLLWVYEGQTELWGVVLASRAGLLSRQQALDLIADYAATQQARVGRVWKTLADTTNDPVYMIGHPIVQRSWQRREDFYGGGLLLWLDVAMTLQRLSHGEVALDDFAHSFFGGDSIDVTIRTYDDANILDALNGLAHFDWRALLAAHLDAHDDHALLEGLEQGGYRLIYTNAPTRVSTQEANGDADFSYSIGLIARPDGRITAVGWDGPAYQSGLAPGARIESVGSQAFSPAALSAAIDSDATAPIRLGIGVDDAHRTVVIPYHGPQRYPRLERISGTPDLLGAFLAAGEGSDPHITMISPTSRSISH